MAVGSEHLRVRDEKLRPIIESFGPMEFSLRRDFFASLVESILSQQLSGSAAASIIKKVKRLDGTGRLTAEPIYRTPARDLRKAGVSPQKLRYLKDLSRRVVNGEIDFRSLRKKSDEEIISALDPILGVGLWTVQMLLIFALGRPDVLPVNDLGIRKSIQKVYALPELPKSTAIETLAVNWHPFCSVASLYLWRAVD